MYVLLTMIPHRLCHLAVPMKSLYLLLISGFELFISFVVFSESMMATTFAISLVFTLFLSYVYGKILDNYGPRITSMLGNGCMIVGSYLLSISSSSNNFWIILPAFVFLCSAFGGIQFSLFNMSQLFKNDGMIVAIVDGFFMTSSGVSTLLYLTCKTVSNRQIFFGILALYYVFMLFFTVRLWPEETLVCFTFISLIVLF